MTGLEDCATVSDLETCLGLENSVTDNCIGEPDTAPTCASDNARSFKPDLPTKDAEP